MLADEVERAKSGDRAAFGRLVERFQDMAFACAIGWLGDAESARDAAQDAFIDAYLHLGQLEQPAAFPGWLRRIVIKHCDRRTRRAKAEPEVPALPPPLDDQLADREAREWLRRAIESLPDHERIVVALHYLGDEPQQDVADFLELPLTTVKKRLHTARKRLESWRSDMEAMRPSKAKVFAERIQLFLAIRAGDAEGAAAILDAHPELLEAEEQWTAEEALAGGFPLAHRSTPLTLAVSRGDRAIVEMLLARGARVEATCGCENGESALWNAVLHGRTEIAELLLAKGADANAANTVGHTPLHLAAMRGRDRLMQVLLQHGADASLRANNGMTAADYAELDRSADDPFRTGIRAIDGLVPLARKMAVRVQGAAETGLMVLMAELSRRFGDRGLRSSWIAHEQLPWQRRELETLIAELGIDDCTTVGGERRGRAVFVFLEEGRVAEVEAALPRLIEEAEILFVIDPWLPVTRGERAVPELKEPYDAVIVTSRELAREEVYPAIDPELSRSKLSDERSRSELARDRERLKQFLRQPFFTWQHQNGLLGS